MNKIHKILLLFTVFMCVSVGYSQNNADPGIAVLMMPANVIQGETGILSATVGNYGNMTISANSLKVTITVGVDAEIIGVASGSDTRWTQLSLSTGSGNSMVLTNTAGGFSSFDVGDILLTVKGKVVNGANVILGNIAYFANSSQGDASIGNDSSQTSITVIVPVIDAVADSLSGLSGGTAPISVKNNDTLNGNPIVIGTLDGQVKLTSAPNGPLSINPATGIVSIAPNTPLGTYPISYTICEVTNPSNCDTTTATVTLTAPIIDAVADSLSGIAGGTSPISVKNNDTLNGNPIVIGTANGQVKLTSTPNGPLSINPTTGIVSIAANTPIGSYPISYTICEVTNPSNCDTVTTTVTVNAPVIDAVDDALISVNGIAPTVITNDRLNGNQAVIGTGLGNVKLTSTPTPQLSIDPATGTVTVAVNTPVGMYSIPYMICEITNPSNCDTATAVVTVPAPDFTPTVDIDDVVFSSAGVSKDFVVNISELGLGSSIGQIVFIIPKQSAFNITYNPTATTSGFAGGTTVKNSDWVITENSTFVTATLKPNVIINRGSFSNIGFTITRKLSIPSQTWQNITPTINNGSGSDSVNTNNTYNVLVKAQ